MRIDKHIIRHLHAMSPELADDWRQRPLVLIPPDQYNDIASPRPVSIEEKISCAFWNLEWLPFRRAIYTIQLSLNQLERISKKYSADSNFAKNLKGVHNHAALFLSVEPSHLMDPNGEEIITRAALITEVDNTIRETTFFNLGREEQSGYTDPQPYIVYSLCPEERQPYMTGVIVSLFNTIYLWNQWVQTSDHYFIEAKNKPRHLHTAKEIKHKPWKDDDYTVILALNRMPSKPHESQGGHHASPRGHDRRGHWRRLDHPRFRNHPKYGQRIWIKPTWIGALEKDYRGKIYRVVDPLPMTGT